MSEDDPNLAIRDSVKFPCTARAKLSQIYRERLKKEWNNKKHCDLLQTQNKGIEDIKKHIAQTKRDFLCHQNERFKSKIRRQQEVENKILTKYKMCLKNEDLKKKIANRLIEYNKIQNTKMRRQEERMMQIVQKITSEYEWKEQSKVKKETKWKPKPKKSSETVFIPDEAEEFLESIEEEEWEEFTEKEGNEKEEISIKAVKKPSKDIDEKEKKDIKDEKETKIQKETKDMKDKKEKPDKKGSKKEKERFIMPEVPITNPRKKICLGEVQKMTDLLLDLVKYDKFIEDEEKFYRKPEPYPINKQFGSIQPELLFENFENGKKYKKKIHIQNRSAEIYHCKYEDIKSDNDVNSADISVEEVGIQKVLPGCSFPITIEFSPKDVKTLRGELIFTTRKPGKPEISQFAVPFRCELPSVNITVNPKSIIFKSLPVWEMKNHADVNYKAIQVRNRMISECILVVRKIDIFEGEFNAIPLEDNLEEDIDLNKESMKHNSENSAESDSTIEILLDECLKHVSNIFHFDSYFYKLPPKSVQLLKIYWRNSPFIGVFYEKFELEFLQKSCNEFVILNSENILVQAETTGKFIETNVDCIDYSICVLNNVYQQSFKVYNYGNSPIKLGFQYPSKLKDYFTAMPASFYLKPNNYENISLRFIPRQEILLLAPQMKYLDPYSNILSCPIKICILSSKPTNVPPTILTVYAILTEPDDIKLRYTSYDNILKDGCPVLHLGKVTTHETVTADLEIENLSPVRQEFAFLNLPQIISIMPNYGFGVLEPNEIKKLTIGISPTCFDLITSDCKHSCGPEEISRKITCTTVYKLGGIPKKKFDTRSQRRQETLETKFDKEYLDITEIISETFESDTEHPTSRIDDFNEEPEEGEFWINEMLEEETKDTKQLTIIVKATLFDYWTELSHQHVIFPDTPLGSHTTMTILFSAINNTTCDECSCGFVKKNKMADFDCHFEVSGGSKDITIEPICGDLKKGQSVHLLVRSRPTVESETLDQTATVHKLQRMASQKSVKKGGKKEKPEKKSARSEQTIPENISLHNCDYYPAEKEVARFLRPYVIEAKFCFVVTFPEYLNKGDEILYLTTECTVISPDFVTNLTTQFINFGPTVINTRPKIVFDLQNTCRRDIEPKISPLNPAGPFICTNQIQSKLEKEFILKVPITFAPTEETFYKEYFEIKSGNTVESLMVSGEGVELDIEFAPKFAVCRIQAKIGKSADCIFGVNNKCRAPLNLFIQKVCDLQGKIQSKPIPKEELDDIAKKGKDKKSEKTSKKSDKKQKIKKFSEDLTSDEEYSVENFFEPFQGETKFKVMNAIDDCVSIEPENKSKLKIRFETPKPPADKTKDKEKGKGKDKDSKASKGEKAEKDQKGITYLAKYNIMLEKTLLLKDIIILAEFQ